jgi:hypothetical protein
MAMNVYTTFAQENHPKNKEGIIQLLFDIRYLFDILNARKEIETIKDLKALQREIVNVFINAPFREDDDIPAKYGISMGTTKESNGKDDELDEVISWNNRANQLIQSIKSEVIHIHTSYLY